MTVAEGRLHCRGPECVKPVYIKKHRLCRGHYAQHRLGEKLVPLLLSRDGTCSHESNPEQPIYSLELCLVHYFRQRRLLALGEFEAPRRRADKGVVDLNTVVPDELVEMSPEEFSKLFAPEPVVRPPMKQHRSYSPWTEEEDAVVMRLELRPAEVAKMIGRSSGAVRRQRHKLRQEGEDL